MKRFVERHLVALTYLALLAAFILHGLGYIH